MYFLYNCEHYTSAYLEQNKHNRLTYVHPENGSYNAVFVGTQSKHPPVIRQNNKTFIRFITRAVNFSGPKIGKFAAQSRQKSPDSWRIRGHNNSNTKQPNLAATIVA